MSSVVKCSLKVDCHLKKIGIITEDYWKGGLARFTINLVNNWSDSNAQIFIFTNKENTILNENISNSKVEYVYFDFKTVSSDMGIKRSILKKIYRQTIFKYGFFLIRYFTLKKLLRRYDIDSWLVSSGGYPGSDLCRLALWVLKKMNALFVFHSAMKRPMLISLLPEILLDKIIFYKNRCRVVTVSHINARTLTNRPWLDNLNINVIHNGISHCKVGLNKKFASSYNIVSTISTFPPYKGHDIIIKAACYLKSNGFDLRIKFYGTDFEKLIISVKKKIESSKHPEIFSMPGFEEVDQVMEEADLIVVPSLNFESFGYAVAEAIGYGVPVIVSDIGGLPEVLGDCGIVCKAGDVREWADAIKKALTDDNLREKNIEKGLKRAKEQFGAEKMAQEYEKMLLKSTYVGIEGFRN